jgi:hypothetical protein
VVALRQPFRWLRALCPTGARTAHSHAWCVFVFVTRPHPLSGRLRGVYRLRKVVEMKLCVPTATRRLWRRKPSMEAKPAFSRGVRNRLIRDDGLWLCTNHDRSIAFCALRDLGRYIAFGKIPSMTVSLAQQRARAMEQRSENELITLHSSEFTRLSAVRSRVAASRRSPVSAQPDEPGADRTVGTREFKKRATDGRDLDTQSRDKT